ncbi:MAG: response regulator [Sphingomonas sp. 28-66-16]|nr:MAG: response regulator [Sphingomonas sp. 28-66-16]
MLFGKKKRAIVRLLIVEDEPLIAFDAEHLLVDAGYEIVATVDRVADAVATIDSGESIDLVLVDISLADGSGLDVAHAARRTGIRVLFVTGEFPSEARSLADGSLAKPYQQRDLLLAIEAIEAVIGGKAPKRVPAGFTLFRDAA